MYYYYKNEILSSFGKVDLKFYLKKKVLCHILEIQWQTVTKSTAVISTEVLILLVHLTRFSMWDIFTVIV